MLNLWNQNTSLNQYINIPITKTFYYPTLDKRNSSFFNEKKSFNQIFSSYTFSKTENKNSPRIPYCQKTTFRKTKCISNNVSTEYEKSINPLSIIRRSSLHEILIRKRKNQREEIKLLLQKPSTLLKQSIIENDFKKANVEEKFKSNIHNYRKLNKTKEINNKTNYKTVSTNSKYSSSQKARFNTSCTKYSTEIENKLTDFERKEINEYKNVDLI